MEAILTESRKKDLCCRSHSQDPCHQIKARETLIILWSFLPINRIIETQSWDGLGFCAFHFIFLRSPLGMWLFSGHNPSFCTDAGEREHFTASIWDPGLLLWIKERLQAEQSSGGLFQRRFLGDIASYRIVLLKLRCFLVFPSVFCIYLIYSNYADRLLLLGFRKTGDCFPFQSSLLIYDIRNQNLQGLSVYQVNEAKWSVF